MDIANLPTAPQQFYVMHDTNLTPAQSRDILRNIDFEAKANALTLLTAIYATISGGVGQPELKHRFWLGSAQANIKPLSKSVISHVHYLETWR